MTPEGRVKARVRKCLHDHDIYTFPVNQRGIGRRGIPDDFLIVGNSPVFIEYKAHIRWGSMSSYLATQPTPLQVAEMEQIRKHGGYPLVIDDATAEPFMGDVSHLSNDWLGSADQMSIIKRYMWNISLQDFMRYTKLSPSESTAVLRFTEQAYLPTIDFEVINE